MIQRIQTVYLFLAVVLCVVCLCLQIGSYEAGGVAVVREYNLWVTDLMGDRSFRTWPLFAVLVLSSAVGFCDIFLFRNRKMQARVCFFNVLLIAGWYILYAVYSQLLTSPEVLVGVAFQPSVAAFLPAVAIILYVMARRSILADEKLVRAADRIR